MQRTMISANLGKTLIILLATLCGCSDTRPTPIGLDTYLLDSTGAWSWSSGGGLASDLCRTANSFCEGQDRKLMPVNVRTKDGSFNNFGQVSLEFRCLINGTLNFGAPT